MKTPTVFATPAGDADFRPDFAVLPGETLISLSIPGEPRPKGRPVVARGKAFTPARTQVAETDLRWALKAALRGRGPDADHLIAVELFFFCASSHAADLDNLVKLVLDAANTFVWRDDRQVVHVVASVSRGAAEPRTLFRAWTVGEAA